jgi:hypothetical protein
MRRAFGIVILSGVVIAFLSSCAVWHEDFFVSPKAPGRLGDWRYNPIIGTSFTFPEPDTLTQVNLALEWTGKLPRPSLLEIDSLVINYGNGHTITLTPDTVEGDETGGVYRFKSQRFPSSLSDLDLYAYSHDQTSAFALAFHGERRLRLTRYQHTWVFYRMV